ncbi:MAG: PAS domain S-box protein [Candidatus Hodarchaeota archaeon]
MPRVLLVDDDEHLLAFAKHFLPQDETSLEIVTAKSAHDAFNQLKNENIDVIVSDYQMPGINGLEFLKRVRGDGSAIPFIIFTGHGHEDVAMQALNLGADYYLKKDDEPPNMFRSLTHAIHQVLKNKQLEDAVRESEERYRLLCEAAFEGIAIHYKGEIVEANQALAEQFGYEFHELLGKNGLELVAPEFRDTILKQIQSKSNKPFEGLALRKNGSVFPARAIARNAFFKGKPVRIAAFQDLTYQAVVEDQTELICRYLPGGILTFVNDAYCRYFGKPHEELIGRHFLPLILEEDQEMVENKIASLNVENPVITYEHRAILSNGDVRWQQWTDRAIFDEQGQILEFQAVGMDITERKYMEQELQESEERYRLMFQDSPISLWEEDFSEVKKYFDHLCEQKVADFREYFDCHPEEVAKCAKLVKIVNVNNATLNLYGADNQENFRDGLATVFGEETSSVFKEELIALSKGHTIFESEAITYSLQGEKLYIELKLTVAPGYEETLSKVIVSVVDISEHKQMENALQESEGRYRTLIELLFDGMVIHEAGMIRQINSAAAEMFGYECDELIGKSFFELIPSEFHDITQISMTKELAKPFEIIGRAKDGHQFHLEVVVSSCTYNGKNAQMAAFRDISDRKEGEKALRESEQRFRTIFESTRDSIFIKDRSLKYTHANPAMEKLFDKPVSELIGRTDSELFNEQSAKQIQETDFRVLAGEIIEEEHTKPVKGIPHTFHVIKVPLRKNGKIESICGVARDITDLKQGEEELKQQKQELSEFAHNMAHDLRNSLLSIEGYAEILLESYDTAHIEKIRELAVNMNHLLHRSVILADSGLVISSMGAVNLGSLLQEVSENIIPKSIKFTHDPLPTVLGDYEKLKQVFQNLFENAVVHGKPTAIQVLRYDLTETINLLVTNDGIPILSEHRQKIFRQGFTTKKDGKGLGLAIVQKIVEAHGWQISLDQNPRTTFQIMIPEKSILS